MKVVVSSTRFFPPNVALDDEDGRVQQEAVESSELCLSTYQSSAIENKLNAINCNQVWSVVGGQTCNHQHCSCGDNSHYTVTVGPADMLQFCIQH